MSYTINKLDSNFNFDSFYNALSNKNFLIYPGKLTVADTFRIGCIGNLNENDMKDTIEAIKEVIKELKDVKKAAENVVDQSKDVVDAVKGNKKRGRKPNNKTKANNSNKKKK